MSDKATTFLLFARADHPRGYGHVSLGTAHGYVVVAVVVKDEAEFAHVQERMARRPFTLPDGNRVDGYQWYGGHFDYLGCVDSSDGAMFDNNGRPLGHCSYGDNRFFGLYTADEVLRG